MSIIIWVTIGTFVIVSLYFFRKWNLRPVEWKSSEVSNLLNSWIDNDVDDRMWDYFEACEISNPELEQIRQRALKAVYFGSPFLERNEESGPRLNENGKELFKELISTCSKIQT